MLDRRKGSGGLTTSYQADQGPAAEEFDSLGRQPHRPALLAMWPASISTAAGGGDSGDLTRRYQTVLSARLGLPGSSAKLDTDSAQVSIRTALRLVSGRRGYYPESAQAII